MHATKLPLSTWLKAMWLLLQSDKGMSSVRLAETLGVSQPTAWRIGHTLRLMVARENMLDGTVEIDHFYLGGRPRKQPDEPPSGRGRKGQTKTEKTPVVAIVQRPGDALPGSPAGDARASTVSGQALRKSGNGRENLTTLWSRVPPALQFLQVFRSVTGRQMRRRPLGGIVIKSKVAVFG